MNIGGELESAYEGGGRVDEKRREREDMKGRGDDEKKGMIIGCGLELAIWIPMLERCRGDL
jgi:hypothetical protein